MFLVNEMLEGIEWDLLACGKCPGLKPLFLLF